MIVSQIEFKGIKALVRKDTCDEFVVKEVMGGTYKKLNIKPTDVVLDIGLNIGMFVCYALNRGAYHVFAFEPEKQNFDIARHNTQMNKYSEKSTLRNLAVVGNNDKKRDLSVNLKANKGLHSLINKRGRDAIAVKCENINSILNECKPDIIKIDCEGGEYEILKSIKSFRGIREMIIEFHHWQLNDSKTHEKYKEITDLLKQHFDDVIYKDNPKHTTGASLIYCKKDDIRINAENLLETERHE